MTPRLCTRADTLELKSEIERRLGQWNADKYFSLLARFLSLKLQKREFDRLCIATIGKENVMLHNHLIRSIIKNARIPKTKTAPLENKKEDSKIARVSNGLCRDIPRSPQKGRTPSLRDRKFKDRGLPFLGPHRKDYTVKCNNSTIKLQEQHSAIELLSPGSRPPSSEEDGEEVVQSLGNSSFCNWKPIRAPMVIPNVINTRPGRAKVSFSDSGFLPSTGTFRDMLERRLEGLKVSIDCADLLNRGLDIFLKGLMRPCLMLASSRARNKYKGRESRQSLIGLNSDVPIGCIEKPKRLISASIVDFRVAVESNPTLLGKDWPIQLEKVCLRESEERIEVY
ncbi:hypothetical protein CRG98_008290 [Punica granatum]|nr:hypothetical protein CRG98_008290 [Punica granatum]